MTMDTTLSLRRQGQVYNHEFLRVFDYHTTKAIVLGDKFSTKFHTLVSDGFECLCLEENRC